MPRQQRKECIEKKAGKLADAAKQDGWSYKLNALPGTDLPALLVQPSLLCTSRWVDQLLFSNMQGNRCTLCVSLIHTHLRATRFQRASRFQRACPVGFQTMNRLSLAHSLPHPRHKHTQLRRFSTSFKHACPDHDNPDRQEELRNLAWTMRAARSFLKVSENE